MSYRCFLRITSTPSRVGVERRWREEEDCGKGRRKRKNVENKGINRREEREGKEDNWLDFFST